MSIPGSQVWDAASIDMKLQINVLFWTTAESPSSQQCTIPAYSVVISFRLLTQHIVHARESLAMSCVNATVTQHISAGDSFFLFAPCFHSCSSSPLFQWLFLFSLHIVQLFYILYSIFTDKKIILKKLF